MRYSRLSRVRRLLGYNGPAPEWLDADKIALDSNYMAVDIVINYAADGLVLCFMHAVVDLTPRDNDEHNKTGWTNWCGTPAMGLEQAQLLYSRLQSTLAQPPTASRVFQILLNQPNRPLCLSWPNERPGEPTAKDFARLAEEVQISSSGTDAKTSCTRRYKACQTVAYGMGDKREVESIFIPHGTCSLASLMVKSLYLHCLRRYYFCMSQNQFISSQRRRWGQWYAATGLPLERLCSSNKRPILRPSSSKPPSRPVASLLQLQSSATIRHVVVVPSQPLGEHGCTDS